LEPLPPPTQGEVERLLRGVRQRVLRLLERRGALPAQGPEDARQAYQAQSLQQHLRGMELALRPPPKKQPRCAFLEGFSLHANTHLHASDRQGLERLCRYGARGALTLTRLKRQEDGRLSYRMKRPLPDGTRHLFFSGLELLRRLSCLVPPPRAHLTRFHGVFAPGAKLKPWVRPQQQAQPGPEVSGAPVVAAEGEHTRRQPPRLDWAYVASQKFRAGHFRLHPLRRQAQGGGVPLLWARCALHPGAPGTALAASESRPGPGATPERGVLSQGQPSL
jgi:hypothetical protein